MPDTCDVTIIGAGPAGSAAALLLARTGWAVTLVEQHRFPRDKVCGECVSAVGFEVLTRLGLRDRFLGLGAVPLHFTTLHGLAGRSARLRMPQPMWGLSRRVLDQMLLDAARESGVTIRQPVRCESLEPGAPPVLRVRDPATNVVGSSRPTYVIVADGKAAFGAQTPPATNDFGIKTHFTGVVGPPDSIELFTTRGTYGGLAPIEAGRWNAAFSVPAGLLREHRGDVDALFATLAATNAALRSRLATATRTGPWLAAPLPRFAVRGNWPAGIIPVGNAAAALEPIGGEGMGLALRSAELAAHALVGAGSDPSRFDRSALLRAYNALWRSRRAGCRAAARVVSSERMGRVAISMLARGYRIGDVAMYLMGKGTSVL